MSNYKWTLSVDTISDVSGLDAIQKKLNQLSDDSIIELKYASDGKSATDAVRKIIANINNDLKKGSIDFSHILDLGNLASQLRQDSDDVKELTSLFSSFYDILRDTAKLDMTGVISDTMSGFDKLAEKLDDVSDKLSDISKSSGIDDASWKDFTDLVSSIEKSLSTIKETFSSIGDDGNELNPLLNKIEELSSSLGNLKEQSANLKLNMNLDIGSSTDTKQEIKISKAQSKMLNAYRSVFSKMLGTHTTKNMLNFVEPEGASISEIIGQYANTIAEAEKNFEMTVIKNGKAVKTNVYKQLLGDDYKKEIENAQRSLNNALKTSDSPSVSNLFGFDDLTSKLEEIRALVEKISSTFENGFVTTTASAEVTDLTNKVKALEEELNRVRKNNNRNKQSYPNAKRMTEDTFLTNEAAITNAANASATKNGGTILGNNVDVKFEDGLAKVTAKVKEADGTWKTFSAKVDSDLKLFGIRFTTVKTGVDKLDKQLANFNQTRTNLTFEETIKEAERLKTALGLGADDKYEINVDNTGLVTIKKKLDDVNDAGKSVVQTFKSVDEAIANFATDASNAADKTKITLKSNDSNKKASNSLPSSNPQDVSKALSDTQSILQKMQDNANKFNLADEFSDANQAITNLNSSLSKGEISIDDYKDSIDKIYDTFKQQKYDSLREVWDANNESVDTYIEAVSQLNKIKASSQNGNSDFTERIKLAEDVVSKATPAFEKAEQYFHNLDVSDLDNIPVQNISELVEILSKIQTAADGSADSVARLQDAISKMNSDLLKKAENTIASASNAVSTYEKRGDTNSSTALLEKVSELKIAASELRALYDELNSRKANGDIITDNDISNLKQAESNLSKMVKDVASMSKGATELSRNKLSAKIAEAYEKYSGMSSKFKNELRAIEDELNSLGSDADIKALNTRFIEWEKNVINAKEATKSLLDVIKDKAWYGFAAQLGTMFSIYDVWNMIRQASQNVIELNTNIVELSKVSEATMSQLYNDFDDFSDIAKDIGGTISDVISATADWSRNGYSLPDAEELARVALVYKNVGDGIDIDAANESLISTLKGFKLQAEDAMHIVDVFNEVSNHEAISSAGIGEALQESAASLNAANTSLEKSVALVTATNSVLQDTSRTGNMWKTKIYDCLCVQKCAYRKYLIAGNA